MYLCRYKWPGTYEKKIVNTQYTKYSKILKKYPGRAPKVSQVMGYMAAVTCESQIVYLEY